MSDPGTSYRTRLNMIIDLGHLQPLLWSVTIVFSCLPCQSKCSRTRFFYRDEVQEMRKTRDPITGFRDRIIGAELAETSEIKAIELEVKQSVDADVKKAKVRSPWMVSQNDNFFNRVTVRLGRRSSILTYMKTTLVARYMFHWNIIWETWTLAGEGHFLKGLARAQENSTGYQRLKAETQNYWVWPGGRIIKAYHMFLWPSVELTCFQRNYWATI